MTPPPAGPSITLGIFPTARGFGWAAFENPLSVRDFGTFTALTRKGRAVPTKNGQCLTSADQLMARLKPETVVLEVYAPEASKRSQRVAALCASIETLARDRGHEVVVIARAEVQSAFIEVGVRTRDDVAAAVARSVPDLAPRLPKPRRTYESENKGLALFNAAALVLTHYRMGAKGLLEDLAKGA